MNLIKNLTLISVITLGVFTSCKDSNSETPKSVLETQLETQLDKTYVVPKDAEEIKGSNGESTSCKITYYQGDKKVGEKDCYKDNFTVEDKTVNYEIKDGKFNVQKTSSKRTVLNESYDVSYNVNGSLKINDTDFKVRLKDGSMILYFDTKSLQSVMDILLVTLDKAFVKTLKVEGNISGVGQITIKYSTSSSSSNAIEVTASELVDTFMFFSKRKEDFPKFGNYSLFNTIRVTADVKKYQLLTYNIYPGAKNEECNVEITDQSFDVSSINNKNVRDLFSAMFNRTEYTFKGRSLTISRIEHESADEYKLLVYGTSNGADVNFYIDASKDNEGSWLNPSAS
ncbi:hypothetical protein K5X82_11015 [Halosquirtibacter xylanolyticus]|uniref:hypothetical protein n=1 Tax=Halosquirtibacter xylanolyticus TaxID=3374599 RepID=UPI003748A6A1|nr:hypothetical protein K5X82_11015 [Prolixibacteraceae bacterium]